MKKPLNNCTFEREKAIALGVRELASELRMVEPTDYVAFVHAEQFANIANIVSSAAEMFFKPGTISFGHSGDVNLRWGEPPSVMLDMEFRHQSVNVYFRLILEAVQAGVEVTYVNFEEASEQPGDNTRRLFEAICDARLVPIGEIGDFDGAAPLHP